MESIASLTDPERVAEKIAFYARLEDEDRAAAPVCAEALSGPSAWWRTRLLQAEHRTAGVVRQLLERCADLVFREPADALKVTALAIEISGLIAVQSYPFDYLVTLRGQAQRDHAFVLSYMGRFRDASAAADRAERLFRQTPNPYLELARLDLVRSNIARSLEKYDESVARARGAAQTFESFGDRKRWLQAREYEATALYSRRDYSGALAVLRSLEKESQLLDPEHRALLLNNIGLCLIETGDPVEAIGFLLRAGDYYEKARLRATLASNRHCLGVARLAAGQYRKAMEIFRSSWRELEALGMESTAALSALRLAETLLIIGREPEAAEICRMLISRFTSLGMAERAMIALAFLRETLASGVATPAHVRHVHDFLAVTQSEGQQFIPLQ